MEGEVVNRKRAAPILATTAEKYMQAGNPWPELMFRFQNDSSALRIVRPYLERKEQRCKW